MRRCAIAWLWCHRYLFTYASCRVRFFQTDLSRKCKCVSVNELHPYIAETKCCVWVYIRLMLCSLYVYCRPTANIYIYHHFRRSCCYNAFPKRQNNPQNCPFLWGDPGFHLTRFIEPTRVHNPNGMSIGSPVSAELMVVINRQTDHAASIATGRIITLCKRDAA